MSFGHICLFGFTDWFWCLIPSLLVACRTSIARACSWRSPLRPSDTTEANCALLNFASLIRKWVFCFYGKACLWVEYYYYNIFEPFLWKWNLFYVRHTLVFVGTIQSTSLCTYLKRDRCFSGVFTWSSSVLHVNWIVISVRECTISASETSWASSVLHVIWIFICDVEQ